VLLLSEFLLFVLTMVSRFSIKALYLINKDYIYCEQM
jgi:hypothetical protein